MKTAVIVQARMGSKRFPGKVLADLCGKPVLWHVLTRAGQVKADAHILAVPYSDASVLEPLADECGFGVWAGDEHDVLLRYMEAAVSVSADIIVRITGDCPLIDPEECNRIGALLLNGRTKYASNVYPRTVPKGYDCEAFTFDFLRTAHEYATDPHDREHVTPWMQRNNQFDSIFDNYSVDTPEDLERVRQIMERQQAA